MAGSINEWVLAILVMLTALRVPAGGSGPGMAAIDAANPLRPDAKHRLEQVRPIKPQKGETP